MRTGFLASAVLGLSVAVVGLLNAAESKVDCKCPVSGAPAKEASAVDYKGAKVYFCCNNCPKAFAANTEKFAAKANSQLVQTGQAVQVACPLSGKPCNAEKSADVSGIKVAFCCDGCKGKTEKSADALALIFADADFDKGYTTQTKCPLSGKDIKADVNVTHDGKKVYFCCPGCPDGFKADPAKFTAKLPQFSSAK
ncbi:MAG: YHS domain-containing protein [Planctomycetaceae bacterium]|nr:YHS domain-containing protein [Planctomycetaceae bacterium]